MKNQQIKGLFLNFKKSTQKSRRGERRRGEKTGCQYQTAVNNVTWATLLGRRR